MGWAGWVGQAPSSRIAIFFLWDFQILTWGVSGNPQIWNILKMSNCRLEWMKFGDRALKTTNAALG